jgi:hypothetical protein
MMLSRLRDDESARFPISERLRSTVACSKIFWASKKCCLTAVDNISDRICQTLQSQAEHRQTPIAQPEDVD